jgi:hypothetical protein
MVPRFCGGGRLSGHPHIFPPRCAKLLVLLPRAEGAFAGGNLDDALHTRGFQFSPLATSTQ